MGDWINFYNTHRAHQALGMKTHAEEFRLAAGLVQTPMDRYEHFRGIINPLQLILCLYASLTLLRSSDRHRLQMA